MRKTLIAVAASAGIAIVGLAATAQATTPVAKAVAHVAAPAPVAAPVVIPATVAPAAPVVAPVAPKAVAAPVAPAPAPAAPVVTPPVATSGTPTTVVAPTQVITQYEVTWTFNDGIFGDQVNHYGGDLAGATAVHDIWAAIPAGATDKDIPVGMTMGTVSDVTASTETLVGG